MSSIECSTIFEKVNHTEDIVEFVESISSVPVKTYIQELVILAKTEDKLYEIPSSTIEVSHQNGK